MPILAGVFPLSSAEAKKDFRDIRRFISDDTDSDSSVKSDDVLPSTYPVKPRKSPRWAPIRSEATDDKEIEFDEKFVEESFDFFAAVQISKEFCYLIDGDRDYQQLESQHQVGDLSSQFKICVCNIYVAIVISRYN